MDELKEKWKHYPIIMARIVAMQSVLEKLIDNDIDDGDEDTRI